MAGKEVNSEARKLLKELQVQKRADDLEEAKQLKITVRQYRKLREVPAGLYAALLEQMQQECRDKKAKSSDARRRKRGAKSARATISDASRTSRLVRRLHSSIQARLDDGRAETSKEAENARRRDRRLKTLIKAIPNDMVCPGCGELKVLPKQWIKLIGRRAEKKYPEKLMVIRESGYAHNAICVSCWNNGGPKIAVASKPSKSIALAILTPVTRKQWDEHVPKNGICPCCTQHISTRPRFEDLRQEWKVLLGSHSPLASVRRRFYEWCGRSHDEFGAVCYVCWSEFKSGRPFIGA